MTLWQETGLALSRQSWCDKSARMSLQPPSKIGPDGEESGLLKPSPPLTRLLNHRGLQLKSLEKIPAFHFEYFLVPGHSTLTLFMASVFFSFRESGEIVSLPIRIKLPVFFFCWTLFV